MVMYKQSIKKIPLFSELADQELNLLAASGSRQKFPDKNVIFQEGDSGEVLFIILSGKVKVLLTGKNGQEFILSHLGPGNFFGEMAILESAPRSASVITVERSEFFLLGRKELTELLKHHPDIAMKILKNLSQRLRKVSEQVRSLVMFDVYGRVGRCLLNLAEFQDGVETHGQLLISNRPSFQELANMVGCSRETLSRTLKALKENGSLTVTRNTIYINRLWE
ncbi:Crp/Fnr family transcriptional regulator [Nitrospira sp. T9]|uniref:Crp/Fnr family transcriptional regulator n=1 Tax=unclassified Nitrospira TaxID=2652172 RepID=UPI003F96DA65